MTVLAPFLVFILKYLVYMCVLEGGFLQHTCGVGRVLCVCQEPPIELNGNEYEL